MGAKLAALRKMSGKKSPALRQKIKEISKLAAAGYGIIIKASSKNIRRRLINHSILLK